MYDFNNIEAAVVAAGSLSTDELARMATELTDKLRTKGFDTCSIINAKSGKCPENCKWCAQSAYYHTNASIYPLVGADQMLNAARHSEANGIGRFSIVTSGRKLTDAQVESVCDSARLIRKECPGLSLCISAGLLSKEQFTALRNAGITRCHCNLETSPTYFEELCTTHTIEQKLVTLRNAAEAGMELCSGGIIGMGESERQRIEMAFELKRLGVTSVPVNVLNPINGTPLENMPPLSEDDLIRTVALFRLILPDAVIRFAGGIARFSEATLLRAYRVAVNAAIMGDMLTTAGKAIESNFEVIRKAGYEF